MRGKLLYPACIAAVAAIAISMGLALAGTSPSSSGDEAVDSQARQVGPKPAADLEAADEPLGIHQPRHDHAWTDGDGQIPSRAAASEMQPHLEEFVVRGDEGLAEMDEEGYLDGNGTIEDPYVIDGFRVEDQLVIRDTSAPLVIKDSFVEGQLKLNYAGEHVHVHHNRIHDLRVNENVDREGPTTSGLFEHNEIAFIGQLRHFSGTFAHNEIGPRPDGVVETYLSDTGPADLPEDIVWNFDGYHGAHVHNNTVEGRTDVKLHGHFHGSCLPCQPHAHHEADDFPVQREGADEPRSRHSYRYHVLDMENNTFQAPQADTALRFHDEAHDGDDETANSEPNPYLEDPHEHHTSLRVHANSIREGALVFDIVNADDEDHAGMVQQARIDVTSNELDRQRPRGAHQMVTTVGVHAAEDARFTLADNRYTFRPERSTAPEGYGWVTDGELADATGIQLHGVNASRVEIAGTQGHNATYGVLLDDVRDNTPVQLVANSFDASEEARHER